MAAYYQPTTRQRQPLPSNPSRSDSEFSSESFSPRYDHNSVVNHHESFLIFPAPPTTSLLPAPSIHNHSDIGSNAPVPDLPSPTTSSVSLETSLLNSVASRSPTSSQRSRSRDALSVAQSDWEEVREPLPLYRNSGWTDQNTQQQLPHRLRLRTQFGYEADSPTRPRTRQRTNTSVSDQDSLLEATGSGWAWTLDSDEIGAPGISDPVLSSWRWKYPPSAHGTQDNASLGRGQDGWIAAHSPSLSPKSISALLSDNEYFDVSSRHGNAEHNPDATLVKRGRSKPFLLRLSSNPSPASRRHPERRLQRQRSLSITRNPRPPSYTLPFQTILQAIFSIDQATLDLVEEIGREDESKSADDRQGRKRLKQPPSSLFGVENGPVKDPFAELDGKAYSDFMISQHAQFDHELSQHIRLLSSDPLLTEKVLMNRWFMPINPFSLPAYLINLGWEYSRRGLLALGSGGATSRHD